MIGSAILPKSQGRSAVSRRTLSSAFLRVRRDREMPCPVRARSRCVRWFHSSIPPVVGSYQFDFKLSAFCHTSRGMRHRLLYGSCIVGQSPLAQSGDRPIARREDRHGGLSLREVAISVGPIARCEDRHGGHLYQLIHYRDRFAVPPSIRKAIAKRAIPKVHHRKPSGTARKSVSQPTSILQPTLQAGACRPVTKAFCAVLAPRRMRAAFFAYFSSDAYSRLLC